MSLLFNLAEHIPHLVFPQGVFGWISWLGIFVLLLILLRQTRDFNAHWSTARFALFGVLLIAALPVTFFFGFEIFFDSHSPFLNLPIDDHGPAAMLFAATPWFLAAGFLGPNAAVLIAMINGLLFGIYDSHNFFTVLEYGYLAFFVALALRQRYRTLPYRLLRRPLVTASLAALVYPLFFFISTSLLNYKPLEARLDYAVSRVASAGAAFAMMIVVAGLLAEVAAFRWRAGWKGDRPLEPSPAERSFVARLISIMAPMVAVFTLLMVVSVWYVAGRSAEERVRTQMQVTTDSVAESVPYILETGQILITNMVKDEAFYTETDPTVLQSLLREKVRQIPFFEQLTLIDAQNAWVTGNPGLTYIPTDTEILGVELALQGVQFQSYSLPPEGGQIAARQVFIVAVQDDLGAVRGVLLGYTSLDTNPFTQSLIHDLQDLNTLNGQGILLDEHGLVLFHPNPDLVGLPYGGQVYEPGSFTDQFDENGNRQTVYTQQVAGRSWSVISIVPAREAQSTALEIAVPLIGLLLLIFVLAYIILRFVLRLVSSSLQKLAEESGRIASGNLEKPLVFKGKDEVGQLGQSFEQMRVSLKGRLDEINRLLLVSQGVASTLEMGEAVKPILEGALAAGASSARIVLSPTALPEFGQQSPTRFGLGESADQYQGLDDQVMKLTEQQDRVVLSNPARARLIDPHGNPLPETIVAVALHHENVHYGALWLGFKEPCEIKEDELRFIDTVAGQAALAAANARLYMSALLGRQRLEAILASSPDPVLVTDHNDALLLANPAAKALFANGLAPAPGTEIDQVVDQEALLNLLRSHEDETQSVEVRFNDDRVFHATASPVMAEGKVMGRVCVLSDITYFKEVDALKTEFVSAVSHDLRNPLILIRGYATMLQMVGDLNEQQTTYLNRIVRGVESMSGLVNNLLDLGRIEAGVGLQLEMVPVLDLVRQVVEALNLLAVQRRIDLKLEVPQHSMPVAEADPALLQQAIHNLLDNAIKHTEVGGEVTVSVSVQQEQVLFAIKDNGAGIAPVDIPRLFERFYRTAGRESRQERGSGLGLAIVKSIAERHGGDVRVESRLGQGSTFYFMIPLKQPKPVDQ